jgi:hypothetical protein
MIDTHGHVVVDDETGYFRYADNGLSHRKYVLRSGHRTDEPLPVLAIDAFQSFYSFPTGGFNVATPHWTVLDALIPFPPTDSYEDQIRKAIRRFFEQIPVEVEGYNFLSDLTRLHDLIPQLAESIGATIASGWLNWSFGWAPFLGDLKAIAGIAGRVQKRLQFLRDSWGKRTKLSYQKKFFWSPPLVPYYAEVGTSPFVTFCERSEYVATFKCGAWLTHHLDALDTKLTEIRAIGFALGFGNPIGAVWEAIPFSFILDWLSDATSVFDGFGINSLGQGDFWVRRPTYSITVTGIVRLAQYTAWDYVTGWNSPVYRGTMQVSHYSRWSGIPEAPGLFDLDLLSPKQASLALAIAASGSPY